ncbi:DUF2231 domain-containing protein [Micromonospora sp. NPDC049497]|uniref:DUF2231 domain-containing protein n=1 Tax=Micromonospora sp. NPDC049497 TaxID=3364273 RepID=UPI0037B84EBB
MFDTIADLPIHPLVVHATVIVVPAAALVVGLAGVWPTFRARTAPLALALSALALVLVPVTVQSGDALRGRVPASELIDRHRDLGTGLLPWVIALVFTAGATGWLHRWETARTGPAGPDGGSDSSGGPARAPRLAAVVVAILAVITAAGVVVSVVRIGHSGAEAAWSDVATTTVGSTTPS